jgi:hypothetical protein
MTEPEAMCQTATVQMSEALARWERDGGALAKTTLAHPAEGTDPSSTETLLAEVALRLGMVLQRCDDESAVHYRLVTLTDAPTLSEASNFRLTLDDVETVLMNRNPA